FGDHRSLPAVVGELEARTERDRLGGAGFRAIPAVDAAHEIDLVPLGVSLTWRDRRVGIVLSGEHVDTPDGAGGCAQLATDAPLEPVVVPVQDVPAAMAWRHRLLLLRVLDRDGVRPHLLQRECQALGDLLDHGATIPMPGARRSRR